MIRFWTFAVGLGLIVLAAHNMGRAGFDPQEFQLLGAMIALLAFALTVELFGGWVEAAYADRRDLREAMLADRESARDTGEAETDVEAEEGERGWGPRLKTAIREDPDRKPVAEWTECPNCGSRVRDLRLFECDDPGGWHDHG